VKVYKKSSNTFTFLQDISYNANTGKISSVRVSYYSNYIIVGDSTADMLRVYELNSATGLFSTSPLYQ